MIRTHILPCRLPKATCDALNLHSGRIYSGIVSRHWRLLRQKDLWLSEKALTKLSDLRLASRDVPMHAHSIDAAQQGFFNACRTTRALRKAGFPEAHFPWRQRKFRTTVWKNTAIKRTGNTLELSTGARHPKLLIALPPLLHTMLKVIEVRLVFNKKSRRYGWHVVVENGMTPKSAPGTNTVSVDPGEIHPAVIGDTASATVITCRERRARQRGHAKNLKAFSVALARKKKGSRQYKKLIRARTRCRAKYDLVMRDMEHKISRQVIEEAVERKAETIVYGDIRDIADGIDKGAAHNQRMSQWNHGKVRAYVAYKAEAEGITMVLQDEHHTSQTCPQCSNRHKPRGRTYVCPACRFQAHRDVVGQVNILSAYLHGEPGKLPVPPTIKYRLAHNVCLRRKCQDTGQPQGCSLEKADVCRPTPRSPGL
jgi:putative transposase